jgi:hypothetical protein
VITPRAASLVFWLLPAALAATGCYESHLLPGEQTDRDGQPESRRGPTVRTPEGMRLPERPTFERPDLPPIECTVQPAPECTASFPRVMIVMDASSSMLAGRREGENNWEEQLGQGALRAGGQSEGQRPG